MSDKALYSLTDLVKTLRAELDAANAELQRRGEWEVVDYLPKTPCSCGNCSNSYRAESETLITLQRDTIRVSVVLPEDIRLMRRKPQQEDSNG